jgi:hypothetical protein
MSEQLTAITFKLPESLREKIKTQAAEEERSESGFLRFHLGRLFAMSEAETEIEEVGDES